MTDSTPAPFSLNTKVALITGASRGIGKAIAKAMARAGARVVITARNREPLDEAAREIGGDCVAAPCHAGRAEDIQRLLDRVSAEMGGLDILVNNAATNPHFGPVVSAEETHWRKTFDVNLLGPFLLSRGAVPLMKARGGGVIINVASIVGIKPGEMMGVYSTLKAGLIMLTRVLALELAAAGIRANAIAPGFVKTQFSRALWESAEMSGEIVKRIPQRRMAEPDEIAGAAVFLASDEARYVTGEVLAVDGGDLIG